jgi:rubrerythrin
MAAKVFSVRVMMAHLEDCLEDGIASLNESEVDAILLNRAAEQRNEADAGGAGRFIKIRVCGSCGVAWENDFAPGIVCPVCGVMDGKMHLMMESG